MDMAPAPGFLPVGPADLKERGIDELDIILVSGDAYVDHPAFAAALLARFLEKHGFRTGIIAQPDWSGPEDFCRLGRPRLCFAVSGGNMDSMVCHCTSERRRRRGDLYSPGGRPGLRPDRPGIVYTNRLREAFPGIPVILGGVEASLRRLAHYDYWEDRVRRSLLIDSGADLLVYGMGEHALLRIARHLKAGREIQYLRDLPGTVWRNGRRPEQALALPSFEAVSTDHQAFLEATLQIFSHLNPYNARQLAQAHGSQWVVQNPPAVPLTTAEMDAIYSLRFQRRAHPAYDAAGGIPALQPVQFSITTHRGCFGGCSFCALGQHQGRFIQSRSRESIVAEARELVRHPDFRGSIPDVGGPSANMYGLGGRDRERCQGCRRLSCLSPRPCRNLQTGHQPSLAMLDAVRRLSGVKNVRVASGIRYDLALLDSSGKYIDELCRHYTGGQLKVAPEHAAPGVCRLMNKPGPEVYRRFAEQFARASREAGKKQYLLPYFIAGHPGCGVLEMLELADFLRETVHFSPEQAQNFTPAPMTLSTAMYYTGRNPYNGKKVYVPVSAAERSLQRAILQSRSPASRRIIARAMEAAGDPRIKAGLADLLKAPGKVRKPAEGKAAAESKSPAKGERTARRKKLAKGEKTARGQGPARGKRPAGDRTPAKGTIRAKGKISAKGRNDRGGRKKT